MAPDSVNHPTVQQEQRVRPRAALETAGTLLVLTSVAIGVLMIRFMLVLAHTVLQ
jgi:multisubunit Na+/H+ antiporter MnhC subunit